MACLRRAYLVVVRVLQFDSDSALATALVLDEPARRPAPQHEPLLGRTQAQPFRGMPPNPISLPSSSRYVALQNAVGVRLAFGRLQSP